MLVDFERFHGLWVGGVFIDVDHARRDAVRGTERFLKEGLGGYRVPFGAKEELDGLPVAIDGPILIQPFPFDLDTSDPTSVKCSIDNEKNTAMGGVFFIQFKAVMKIKSARQY